MQKIPLEEAVASVNFPVYGFTEEVCGLVYSNHSYFPESTMPITIEYQSDRYVAFLHEKVKGPTFSISVGENLCPDATVRPIAYGTYWDRNDIPEALQYPAFSCTGTFTIDGTLFKGRISYRPAPICFSLFWLDSERTCLDGQALGPHPDDLIQILEALRVLNRKQVE